MVQIVLIVSLGHKCVHRYPILDAHTTRHEVQALLSQAIRDIQSSRKKNSRTYRPQQAADAIF